MTLTFHPNWCALLPVVWATFLPILVFLGLFDLEIWVINCQMDYVTSRPWHLTLKVTALVGSSFSILVTLTFKLMRIIACVVGNLCTNFCVSMDVSFSTYRQTPVKCITWPCDLGGYGACRRYGSSYSICVPSFKFIGISMLEDMTYFLSQLLVDLVTLTFDL